MSRLTQDHTLPAHQLLPRPASESSVHLPLDSSEHGALQPPCNPAEANGHDSTPQRFPALDDGFVDLDLPHCSVHVLGDWSNTENRQSRKASDIFAIKPQAIASDKDGTVYDSEPAQKVSWQRSVREFTQNHLRSSPPPIEDVDSLHQSTIAHSDHVIERAFTSGEFSDMMIGLFHSLKNSHHLPEGVTCPEELDHELSKVRQSHILEAFRSGFATKIPGVKRCLGLAVDAGMPVGFYTNTERRLAEVMLVHVFGDNFVSDVVKALICREDVPRSHLKPSPYGWALLGYKIGILKKNPNLTLSNLRARDLRKLKGMIIMEDRVPALTCALERGIGGAGVLVAPKSEDRDRAINDLSDWNGKKILIVPNLRPIDFSPA